MSELTPKQRDFIKYYKLHTNSVMAYKAAYKTDGMSDARIMRMAHEMRLRLAEYINR